MIEAGKWVKTTRTFTIRDEEEVVVQAGTRGMVAHMDEHHRASVFFPSIKMTVNLSIDHVEEDSDD